MSMNPNWELEGDLPPILLSETPGTTSKPAVLRL